MKDKDIKQVVEKFRRSLKNLNKSCWNIPYGTLCDELEDILKANNAQWRERIEKATRIHKACLCLERKHCDAKGWNEAIEFVRKELLDNPLTDEKED